MSTRCAILRGVWNRARVTATPGDRPERSVYRVRRAYFARSLGRVAVVAAVLLLLTTVCLALSAPGLLTSALVVLTTIALTITAVIMVSVMLPPTLIQLDRQGFRASKRYSSGRRHADWDEVQGAASQEGPNGWVLVLQISDGGHTAVPLSLADASPVTVEQDVRDRLDDAHGYRPLS